MKKRNDINNIILTTFTIIADPCITCNLIALPGICVSISLLLLGVPIELELELEFELELDEEYIWYHCDICKNITEKETEIKYLCSEKAI